MAAMTMKQRHRKNVVHPQNNTAAPAPAADDSTPAFPAARFNSSGFCINHSNIRLCTVTDEGKYKILRKVCFKCGSSKLRNSYRVNTLHGNAKKVIPRREAPKGMIRATASSSWKDQSPTSRRERVSVGDQNKSMAKQPPSEVRQRRKDNQSRERSNASKNNVESLKKDQNNNRSKELPTATPTPAGPTQLGDKLERSTRRSRSVGRRESLSTTSRTFTNSLSSSELSGIHPPPPGRPTGRSKSCIRQTNSGTSKISSSKDVVKNDNNKPVRSKPAPIMSSSKSVEAKVMEITNSKKANGKINYSELGKLIKTMVKNDETTLPTLPCPGSPNAASLASTESLHSKKAVFLLEKSDLIVELYNKKGSELDDTMRTSNRHEELRKIPKIKQRSSARKSS
eukprot:scaffold13_cov137-Skeletonema_menzelii.AAC.4